MNLPFDEDGFFLFENSHPDTEYDKSYLFEKPLEIIEARSIAEVKPCFDKIEKISEKYYVAGFFSYELGYCLEECLNKLLPRGRIPPLMYFGVYKTAGKKTEGVLSNYTGKYEIRNMRPDQKPGEYSKNITLIKKFLRQGDIYQANYTMKYSFEILGSKYAFYQQLKRNQPVPFSAYLKTRDGCVISMSPELFLNRRGPFIESKPMKGTMARGVTPVMDAANKKGLGLDVKNRSENLMIVDLIRNDFGRFSRTGSVRADKLFEIENYSTLFQMTSKVSAKIKDGISYYDIFKAVFPCGSVTGAPKIRAMQILRELEKKPRGVYCGAVGIFMPGKRWIFSVPIRTMEIRGSKGFMGIGSGIVMDSCEKSEYEECLLKARFLSTNHVFRLFETMLWDKRYFLMKQHLNRMQKSARHFGFPFDRMKAEGMLKKDASKNRPGFLYKVKLMLDIRGLFEIEKSGITRPACGVKHQVVLYPKPVDESDSFLLHKTTLREFYENCYRDCLKRGYYDAIFLNRRGELTEGTFNSVFVKIGSGLFTPPLDSGVLPGVYRQKLLDSGIVKERKLYLRDLLKASQVYLGNSVRSSIRVDVDLNCGNKWAG